MNWLTGLSGVKYSSMCILWKFVSLSMEKMFLLICTQKSVLGSMFILDLIMEFNCW